MSETLELATLAGGCFWCTEAIYLDVIGVAEVKSGYSGGHLPNPTYQQVVKGDTGHAEAIQIKFDPTVINYGEILKIFFATHDPTTLNRQGADIGTQYRSAIFFHSAEQQEIAKKTIDEINDLGIWDAPIVTEVTAYENFYVAEDYHQNYFENNPDNPYCAVVIQPKVAKFRKNYTHLLKSSTN